MCGRELQASFTGSKSPEIKRQFCEKDRRRHSKLWQFSYKRTGNRGVEKGKRKKAAEKKKETKEVAKKTRRGASGWEEAEKEALEGGGGKWCESRVEGEGEDAEKEEAL